PLDLRHRRGRKRREGLSQGEARRARRPGARGAAGRLVGAATLVVRADVAELVDAHGSGPCARKGVEVQVLSSALTGSAARSASSGAAWPAAAPRTAGS